MLIPRPNQPLVRPWALAAPILILLFCLPLLRPLRRAQPGEDEALRLASIQAMLDHASLDLDAGTHDDPLQNPGLVRVNGKFFSDQPPTFAVLLAGPAWIMRRIGYDLRTDPAVVAYVLTLLGVTIPVAGTAGVLYRMSRVFELKRRLRSGLSAAIIAGSGLLSYAVVLNAQAPAACLLIAAAACLVHTGVSRRPRYDAPWIAIAGLLASLAVALDFIALWVVIPLVAVIIVTPFSLRYRVGGVFLFLIGTLPILAVHASFNRPITGDLLPASMHPELVARPVSHGIVQLPEEDADDIIAPPSGWRSFAQTCEWLTTALVGSHGLLSHFPILLLGVGGVGAVMHRHWPAPIKVLASISLAAIVGATTLFCWTRRDWGDAMFGVRWLVPLLPLVMFWSGAWLRRRHPRPAWVAAGMLLAYSVTVSLIGATNPMPREGYNNYTAGQALARLFSAPKNQRDAVAEK